MSTDIDPQRHLCAARTASGEAASSPTVDADAHSRRDRFDSLSVYLREAACWDADRAAQSRRHARIAWTVASVATLAAVSGSLALAALMPLKRVDPFVVRVDNTTGLVDVVPVYTGHDPMPETVTRYLLTHYVEVCERFNFATAESDYQECGAFHTPQRNQLWYAAWNPNNPQSPLNLYKDGTTLSIQILSVSFFKRADGLTDLAQVRYTKAKRLPDGPQEQLTHWIATLQYAYAPPSTDPNIRRWNPLGFKIVDFHPEPEVFNEPAQQNSLATSSNSRHTP